MAFYGSYPTLVGDVVPGDEIAIARAGALYTIDASTVTSLSLTANNIGFLGGSIDNVTVGLATPVRGSFAVTTPDIHGSVKVHALDVNRNAAHTGSGDAANPAALSIIHTVGPNVSNKENGLTIVSTVTATGAARGQTTCAVDTLTARALGAGSSEIFGAVFNCQDQTLRKSSIAGAVVCMELDLTASGPDDGGATDGIRVGIDIVASEYATSTDGATAFGYGVRARTSIGIDGVPGVTMTNAFIASAGASGSTTDYGTITNAFRATTYGSSGSIGTAFSCDGASTGLLLNGDFPSNAIKINTNTVAPTVQIGILSNTANVNTSTLQFIAKNGANNGILPYCNVITQITSNVSGSESGALFMQARTNGTVNNEIIVGNGLKIGTGSLAAQGTGSVNASTGYFILNRQVVGPRIQSWGAAVNGSKAPFDGSAATLSQTSAAVAQLIADLTTHGLIGS